MLDYRFPHVVIKADVAVMKRTPFLAVQKRWKATAQDIVDHEVNLTGDIFLSAAFVSYLGGFTGPFRHSLLESWVVVLRDKGIRVSDGFSLTQVSKTAPRREHRSYAPPTVLITICAHGDDTLRCPFCLQTTERRNRMHEVSRENEITPASSIKLSLLRDSQRSSASFSRSSVSLLCCESGTCRGSRATKLLSRAQ